MSVRLHRERLEPALIQVSGALVGVPPLSAGTPAAPIAEQVVSI